MYHNLFSSLIVSFLLPTIHMPLLTGPYQLSITSHIASYGKLGVGPWVRVTLMEDKGTTSGRGLFPERVLLERVHCTVRLNEPPCTSAL